MKQLSALIVFIAILLVAPATLFASSQPYISGHGINFGTGNKYHAETDVRLDGPIPLTFTRTYNSQSEETGILGHGWSASSAERLILNPDDPTTIILVQSGGRQDRKSVV